MYIYIYVYIYIYIYIYIKYGIRPGGFFEVAIIES